MTLTEIKVPVAAKAVQNGLRKVAVVETTVADHNKRLRDNTVHRHLAYEDCCEYCDVHCVERLSSNKQQLIQDWTREVNDSMSKNNDRFEYITKQSTKKLKKEEKLKFQNYSPPGSPDIDDGFRMVPTPVSLRSRKSSAASTRSRDVRRSAHVTRRKLQTTPVQAWEEPSDKELTNRMANVTLATHPLRDSELAHHGSLKSASIVEEKPSHLIKDPERGVLRSASMRVTPAAPPPDNAGMRTCSNTLLNVYSIDDAIRHQRNPVRRSKSAVYPSNSRQTIMTSPDVTNQKLVRRNSEAKPPHMGKIMEEGSRNTTMTSQGLSANENPAPASVYSTENGMNEAVQIAFTNLENSTEVTNNTAYKGLYIYESHSRKETKKPKESKLFRRLNRNLHRSMSEQYQHGSELAYKIRHRYATRRPSSGETTQTTCGSTNATQASQISRENAGISHRNLARSHERFDSRESESAEHFLEMLMNMDQSTAANQNVNIHTFLYV